MFFALGYLLGKILQKEHPYNEEQIRKENMIKKINHCENSDVISYIRENPGKEGRDIIKALNIKPQDFNVEVALGYRTKRIIKENGKYYPL